MDFYSSRRARIMLAILTAVMVSAGAPALFIGLNVSAGKVVEVEGPMQSTTGPLAPLSVAEASWYPPGDYVLIDNVPSYLWYYGCGPTAVGMVVGYWDGQGFGDLVFGTAVVQTAYVNATIASSGHIADYAYPLDNYYTGLLLDKSSLGGAHPSDCVADFMHTSWSSDDNLYGWSWSDMIDNGFADYVRWANPTYSIATTEFIGSGVTWERYVHEIDSGHPAVFLVDSEGDGYTDHFVTAIGYCQNGNDRMYACYDTWSHNVRWCEFAKMSKYQPFGIYDATFFELTKNEAYCAAKTWGEGPTSVSWMESVIESRSFSVFLDNNGLKSAVVEMFDTTSGKATKVFHETVNMRSQDAYPFGWARTAPITLTEAHTYIVWVGSLDGPVGSYVFAYPTPIAPSASFTWSGLSMTVTVDASASYDIDGTIAEYVWTWGDGYISTGVTSSHVYPASGTRYVTLKVIDNDGLTDSAKKSLPPPVPYYVAGFTLGPDGALLPDCVVTVTNLRTEASLTAISGGNAYYSVNLNEIEGAWESGDVIRAAATKDTMYGSSEGIALESTSFLILYVTLA